MKDIAEKIYQVIKDYRNEDGIFITVDDICNWALQFGEEAEFMLSELCHLLPKIYFSKNRVNKEIRKILNDLYTYLKFDSRENFFSEIQFLSLQPEGKSQQILLQMVDDVAYSTTSKHLSHYKDSPKKVFVYLDDVLATGGTIGRDLISWMKEDDRVEKIGSNKISLFVVLLCSHSLGKSFVDYRINLTYPELKNKINWGWAYEIQNHLKWANQSLNIAIPIKDQPEDVRNYLSTLRADKYEDYAYREINNPQKETFFSSPENRIRYENNLLRKGLDIIARVKNPGDNLRPLGMVNPRYKTFGLGTHFFTWRNIPNNSPLVFWWDLHNWKPLFKPKPKG